MDTSRKDKSQLPEFVSIASAYDGAGHSIGITSDGMAWSWGSKKGLGRLGREGTAKTARPIDQVSDGKSADGLFFVRGFAGGNEESGHSALIDRDGNLWMFGCDRWQQLGLGSSKGGSAGYTWSSLWKQQPTLNTWIWEIMPKGTKIRDMALGADHSVILSSNQKDIIVFGKGSEGQLGLGSFKPFVSAPARSKELSSCTEIAAVCAINHCSVTLNRDGSVQRHVGKCRLKEMEQALQACRQRARYASLL